MAVPKKKTSKSKRDQRRSHDALKAINIGIDKTTGEYVLPHHACAGDGTYRGQKMVIFRKKSQVVDNASQE
jgi:large subunit ribosomal protein L32